MGRAEVLLGRMAHSVVGRGACQCRGRSGGGVRLRPVSGIRGEGGGVLLMGAGASGAPVLVLEAVGCGRRAGGP